MNLHDALDNLPEFDPVPDLWNRISDELDAEATIDRAMLQLPEFEPTAELWEAIERDIDPLEKITTPEADENVRPLWQRPAKAPFRKMTWLAAAATVAGLIGSWFYVTQPPRETVSVSVEIVKPLAATPAPTPPIDPRQFIAKRCKEEQTLCNKPEVKELQLELADLDNRQAELNQQLTVFGNDPQLVEAQTRLQTQRDEVTKELVALLAI